MAWNPFIGTCRVLDAAHYLRRELNLPALHTAHRVHSLPEIERLVGILAGGPIDQKTLHTLSDAAFADLFRRQERLAWTVEFLGNLQRLWVDAPTVVIEVSTLKQNYVETPSGPLWVNFYTARDLETYKDQVEAFIAEGYLAPIRAHDVRTHPFRETEALERMARIKALVRGKRIIWVSHFNVSAVTEETKRLHEVRSRIASVVSHGARLLGDEYYDPTEILTELGERKALAKDGTDYNHYTTEAMRAVAMRYWRLVKPEAAIKLAG